ncbi:hypothetical protein BASA81_008974 [Batrachochytrium salamandrivorans]|nr:hypothetical protein BASA81_008974 [Batrachochytrium salamandrivorans]
MGIYALGSLLEPCYQARICDNLYKAEQSEGNIVAMRIIIGAMMIQQCNPTFLAARDAILSADKLYYKRCPTSARSTRDLPSVALVLGLPTFAKMTFRFHLNVSSDSVPASYDDISTAY